MRKTQYEQMFSALTPTADILGERAVHGAFPFQIHHYANRQAGALHSAQPMAAVFLFSR
jgi:hypothetical protein